MSVKNYHVHSDDQGYLEGLAEDYASMGRDVKLEDGHLTVFSRKTKPVKKKVDRKPKREVESEDKQPSREQRPKRRD